MAITFTRDIEGNYLCVRGEYLIAAAILASATELPPRARRILPSVPRRQRTLGTTSACAENTIRLGARLLRRRNYLRVRGEYWRIRRP